MGLEPFGLNAPAAYFGEIQFFLQEKPCKKSSCMCECDFLRQKFWRFHEILTLFRAQGFLAPGLLLYVNKILNYILKFLSVSRKISRLIINFLRMKLMTDILEAN